MTVQEATERAGISRSSFYNIKRIFFLPDQARGRALTFVIQMDDTPEFFPGFWAAWPDSGGISDDHQSIPITVSPR